MPCSPVEQLVANWRGFVASRQGWRRLKATLANFRDTAEPMPLPAPKTSLVIESLAVVPPGPHAVAHEYRRLQRQDAAPGGRSVGVRRCARRGWSERIPGTKDQRIQFGNEIYWWYTDLGRDSRYGELR